MAHKKWFSWIILILLTMLNPALGIIYLLYKGFGIIKNETKK